MLIVILTCALLVIYHAAAAEELEAKDVIESKALATLDEERFECVLKCDIKYNGKNCKGKGENKCSGGWRCRFKLCLKI
uniref:Omega-Theraphotoxin-Sfo1d_1 n=1 Tax=Selenotholus foelschei TaxID=1905327 RepID=A0A482ZA35_9ARAC